MATGTGRVCGESASSAPSSTTSSISSAEKAVTSSEQKPRQRMLGSMPRRSSRSRSVISCLAASSRVVGQTRRSVRPSATSVTGLVTWKS